jgi:cell division protein FtsL
LEPEVTQESVAVPVRPRRRIRTTPRILSHTVAAISLVAVGAALLLAYVHSYARLAEGEFRRQRLQGEIAQLQRDNIALGLELDRLGAQARVAELAKAQGLELPTMDRVQYARVMAPTGVVVAQAPRQSRSWLARSGARFLTAMGHTVQRISRGPGTPAYAQD